MCLFVCVCERECVCECECVTESVCVHSVFYIFYCNDDEDNK